MPNIKVICNRGGGQARLLELWNLIGQLNHKVFKIHDEENCYFLILAHQDIEAFLTPEIKGTTSV